MVELLRRQQALWQLIQDVSGQKAMLRISRYDDCHWVCDLPRRLEYDQRMAVEHHLRESGFLVCFDATTALWQIDLPLNDPLYATGDQQSISFPKREALHPIYALYRMLAVHPCPVEIQPIAQLRRIIKCTAFPIEESQEKIMQLTRECAAFLNRRQPLPAAASHALQQYICQEDAK